LGASLAAVVKRRLVFAIVLAALAVGVGGVGYALAAFDQPQLIVDATKRGNIDFYLAGEAGSMMTVREIDPKGGSRVLGRKVLDAEGKGIIRRASRWRCDRLSRRFVSKGMLGGREVEATYGVRTPACRDRLQIGLPLRARPGGTVRMVIRDGWGIGQLGVHVCKLEPGDKSRCRKVRLPVDTPRITTTFRLSRPGVARVLVAGKGFRISRRIRVGPGPVVRQPDAPRILTAGDSLMQGVDSFLTEKLGAHAKILRDVNPNSGISKPGLNWAEHARERSQRLKPDVAIVFLGANEGFPLSSTGGQSVVCCGPIWAAEYAARVRSMMITYSRGGKADVFWLSIPAPRSPERQALQRVVNAAVLKAAENLPRVRVVRLDEVFTPGGVYRDSMLYNGRRRVVRESDGIHLSLDGARIAADKISQALRAARIVH
jgi:hypothetical protein